MNFTPEQINLAKEARSPEELLVIAKNHYIELSLEQANLYFN